MTSHTIERYTFGYDWSTRFVDARPFGATEGGAIYLSEINGAYYVITDESTMADFLDDDDLRTLPLIAIHRFDTAIERDMYCETRFANNRSIEM